MDSNIVVFAFEDKKMNLNKCMMKEIHGFTILENNTSLLTGMNRKSFMREKASGLGGMV